MGHTFSWTDAFSVVLYMETNVRLQICIFCVCVHVCGCAFKYFMVFSIFMKRQEQCVLPALNFSSRNSCKCAFVYVIIAYPAVHVIHCVNLFSMISPCNNKSFYLFFYFFIFFLLPVALLSSVACELAPLRIVLLCVFLYLFFIFLLLFWYV